MSGPGRFGHGDRVLVEGVGSGPYQRQSTSAAVVVRCSHPDYTVRFFDLGKRGFANRRLPAWRLTALADVENLPWSSGQWEQIETDLAAASRPVRPRTDQGDTDS